MELSNKSEYALLAMLELTTHYHENEPLQIRQIALQQNIPDRYLEQLLAGLRRSGLIRSERGAKGGYLLSREPWKITLLEVVNCIEGIESQRARNSATSKTAASIEIVKIWREARQAADTVLQEYTLQDLLEKQNSRPQSVMYYI